MMERMILSAAVAMTLVASAQAVSGSHGSSSVDMDFVNIGYC